MIAICKKPTTKLVKGARYEIENLWNDGTNQRWLEGRLSIAGLGRYRVSNFTDENGKELPATNIVKPHVAIPRLKFEDLKEGDIIVCTSGNYKSLVQDGMYQIEKLIDRSVQVTGYNGQKWTKYDQKIKLVGVQRALSFTSWSFRKLNSEESREISLAQLLDNKAAPVIKKKPAKKIDLMPNKERVLAEILFKAATDPNRHALSIPEWACQKTAPKLDLKASDFDQFLQMNLLEIFNIIEKKKNGL